MLQSKVKHVSQRCVIGSSFHCNMILLVSVRIISEAWEQNLECILLFSSRAFPHFNYPRDTSWEIITESLMGPLCCFIREQKKCSSARWNHVHVGYNVLHKSRCGNLYSPLTALRINLCTVSASLWSVWTRRILHSYADVWPSCLVCW